MSSNLIFETQRLILKPLLESDLNTLHSIFINPHVKQYLCDDNIWSLQQVEEMVLESQKLFAEKKFGIWLIDTKDENKTIGFVALWYFFDEAQPQLVYALLPEVMKKGYATEASTKILNYCFEKLGYQYLIASCDIAFPTPMRYKRTPPQPSPEVLRKKNSPANFSPLAGRVCFSTGGVVFHLIGKCYKPNIESKKVAERIGMKEVEEKNVDGKPILFFKVESCTANAV